MCTWVIPPAISTHSFMDLPSCMAPDIIIVHGMVIITIPAPAPGVTGLDTIPGLDGASASISVQDGFMPVLVLVATIPGTIGPADGGDHAITERPIVTDPFITEGLTGITTTVTTIAGAI